MSSDDREALVRRAVEGDRSALHELVLAVQRDVHRLALRMLWQREDAEDATQEILVRVVTRLAQFDGRSRFTTWVYRVATNYLLDVKKSPVERLRLDFASFADDLARDASDEGPADGDRSVLVEEVKIGCTMGMLQCLDRPHRLAYVLGDVMELPGEEAAAALEIDAAAFRKRLQRARERIETFMRSHCGLVSDDAACRCPRRVPAAVLTGRASAEAPRFASSAVSFVEARAMTRKVEQARWAVQAHRSSHPSDSTVDFARRVISALERGSAPPRQ